MSASYKQRYDRVKAHVDAQMGRPLGKWGRFKAFFAPSSLSTARKQAIGRAEHLPATNPEGWLYQPHNVIGTTSAPGQHPTVYYRTLSGTFGHITQEHGTATNVGREPARKTAAYTFGNVDAGGRQVLVEDIPGVMHHQSRNALRPISTAQQRAAASNAHLNLPNVKQRVLVTGAELGPQFGGLAQGVHTRHNR